MMPQLTVDLELRNSDQLDKYALIVLAVDLSDPLLYDIPTTRLNNLAWWDSLASDELPSENADTGLDVGEEPKFARFDIYDAKLDDAMIKTDYEAGCVLDASNLEASVNARYCKEDIENGTLSELRSIVNELYTDVHGLGLPVAPASAKTTVRVSHEDMAHFSWFSGLLPWFSRSQRNSSSRAENHPFLDSVLGENRCEDEFKRTSTGHMPCYRDANFSAKTVVPFLADNYAWPKPGFSSVLEKGEMCTSFNTEAQRQACLQAHEERLRVLSRQMIGSDTCKNYDSDGQTFMRACFASFCTAKSHIGRPDSTQYINLTNPESKCFDKESPDCQKSETNDYHVNKTICKFSAERNDRVSNELPSIVDMRSIRGLYANNEVFQFNPDFSRCRAAFQDVSDEYNPPSSNKRCRHQQAPLGFSPQTSRAYLAAHVAPTLDRSHAIPEGKLSTDVFSVSRLWHHAGNSLWAGYNIEEVLRDNMTYPVGIGEKVYALLALDKLELGPLGIHLKVDDGESRMLVHQLALLPPDASNPPKAKWVRHLAADVQADFDFLSRSRLYKPGSVSDTEGWLCQYTKLGLVSGSVAMYHQYPQLRLMTPSPIKMRQKYASMRGLNPLTAIRDVRVADEVTNYAHFGHLHMFLRESVSNARDINVGLEMKLFLETDFAFPHVRILQPPPQVLSLGWPHVFSTLRSGELYAGNAQRVSGPVDISSLSNAFLVKIKHSNATVFEAQNGRFPFYDPGPTYTHTRTTLDRGSVCHKSPLSIIPNSTLREMLRFDACFMVWEDENVTSRQYRCFRGNYSDHGEAVKNFTFMTTSVRNRALVADKYRKYASCSDVPDLPDSVARLRTGAVNLARNELSISTRRRISPVWRRMMDLMQRNLTTELLNPREFWAPEQEEIPVPVVHGANATESDDIFDQGWVYQCPPNQGTARGSIPRNVWASSTDRTALCSLSNPQFSEILEDTSCDISKNIDICKVPGLESLCTLLSTNVKQIREANMRRVGMLSETASLYNPSSFWNNDAEYAWEIVAKTYQKMGLFSQPGAATACANVQSAQEVADVLENGDAVCSSYYALALINLLETARTVFMNLINAAMYLFDGIFEFGMGIVSSIIPDRTISNKFFNSFMQRALDSFSEAWNHFVRVIEQVVTITVRMFLKSPIVDAVRRLAQAICRAFKKFVRACVSVVLQITKTICSITSRIGLGDCSNSPVVRMLEGVLDDVEGWQCTFIINPPCLNQKDCEIFTSPNFPDTCYRGVIGGTDALGGDMYSAPDPDTGRGSYACNSASYCRKSVSEVVFCEECPGDLLANFHCSTDNKCQCGSDPSVVSTCTKTADCDMAESCIQTYGYQTASASVPCVATGTDRVVCMKDSHKSLVGSCSIVKNFETDEMAPCTAVSDDEAARDVTGVCLFVSNSASRPPEVEFYDLFGVRCETLFGAASVSSVPFCTSVITTVPFLRKDLLKVYVDFSRQNSRRLLASISYDQKALDSAHIRYIQKTLVSLGSRRVNVSAHCLSAFDSDLRFQDNSDSAYTCALWVAFWNASLTDTGLSDVISFNPSAAATEIVANPDIMISIFRNLPSASLALAQGSLPGVSDLGSRLNFSRAVISDIWSSLSTSRDALSFHGLRDASIDTPYRANRPSRRLLQADQEPPRTAVDLRMLTALHHTPRFSISLAHTDQEPPSVTGDLSMPRSSRKLLQTPLSVTTQADTQERTTVDKVAELQSWVVSFEKDNLHQSPLVSPQCVFGAPSKFLYFLQQNVQRSLQRVGWVPLPQCKDSDHDLWLIFLSQTCAPVNIVVTTVVNNTLILARYYAHISASDCLSNSSVSCLVPARFTRKTPSEIFPLPNRETPLNNDTVADTNSEQIIEIFIDSIVELLSYLDFGQGTQQQIFWGVFSFKAAYDFDEYERQINGNLFSLGRLLREWLVCDLEESIECAQTRNPLLPSFFAVFFLILIMTTFLPIPSVITFFMWTLGLTLGVVYISYGFSPLCFPRIPVCLFEGIYDIVLTFFPERLETPETLLNTTQGCDFYGVDNTLSTLAAVETVFRQDSPKWSEHLLGLCERRLSLEYCQAGLNKTRTTFELLMLGDTHKTAIYYCITFNFYRIVAFACVAILLIPLALFALLFVISMILLAVRMSMQIPLLTAKQEEELKHKDEDSESDSER